MVISVPGSNFPRMRWAGHLPRTSWGSGLGRTPQLSGECISFLIRWTWPFKGDHPLGPPRAFIRHHGNSADSAPRSGRHGQLFSSISVTGKGGVWSGEGPGRRRRMRKTQKIHCCHLLMAPLFLPISLPPIICASLMLCTQTIYKALKETFSPYVQPALGPVARLRLLGEKVKKPVSPGLA